MKVDYLDLVAFATAPTVNACRRAHGYFFELVRLEPSSRERSYWREGMNWERGYELLDRLDVPRTMWPAHPPSAWGDIPQNLAAFLFGALQEELTESVTQDMLRRADYPYAGEVA